MDSYGCVSHFENKSTSTCLLPSTTAHCQQKTAKSAFAPAANANTVLLSLKNSSTTRTVRQADLRSFIYPSSSLSPPSSSSSITSISSNFSSPTVSKALANDNVQEELLPPCGVTAVPTTPVSPATKQRDYNQASMETYFHNFQTIGNSLSREQATPNLVTTCTKIDQSVSAMPTSPCSSSESIIIISPTRNTSRFDDTKCTTVSNDAVQSAHKHQSKLNSIYASSFETSYEPKSSRGFENSSLPNAFQILTRTPAAQSTLLTCTSVATKESTFKPEQPSTHSYECSRRSQCIEGHSASQQTKIQLIDTVHGKSISKEYDRQQKEEESNNKRPKQNPKNAYSQSAHNDQHTQHLLQLATPSPRRRSARLKERITVETPPEPTGPITQETTKMQNRNFCSSSKKRSKRTVCIYMPQNVNIYI